MTKHIIQLKNSIENLRKNLEIQNSNNLDFYKKIADEKGYRENPDLYCYGYNSELNYECTIDFSMEFKRLLGFIENDKHSIYKLSQFQGEGKFNLDKIISISFYGGEHSSALEEKLEKKTLELLKVKCSALIEAINKI